MNRMEAPGENERPNERRSSPRFRLALPVNVHVAWRSAPVTVELIDIGRDGARFKSPTCELGLEQEAAFGFVIPGESQSQGPGQSPSQGPSQSPSQSQSQHVCVANGRVVRLGDDGEFVLSVDRANDAFHGFLVSLAD